MSAVGGMWGRAEVLEGMTEAVSSKECGAPEVDVRSGFQRVKNTEGDGSTEMARGEDRVRDRAPSSASHFEAQHHRCSASSK
jgi:hypothetical protein